MNLSLMNTPDLDALFAAAAAARANAYAPYSGYAVGAALLAEEGSVYVGCNTENAAYPVGTCAEAGAIAAMAAAGARRIAAMLVAAEGAELVTPCGACRQRIREFATETTPIHLADLSGIRRTLTLGELLPHAFGPDNLAR
jgi:cytidine deaminase